ncbi:hypothetical protein MLD38_011638 [Melastoma candidum]|uniref:Uncharacterized protein n=1 Tax=Melastoma candidum TaxID=119954 RepID=A0ACB9R789_9MYRT|nr:hypothetical protein MLD38_011638 [Melastoma candidum]
MSTGFGFYIFCQLIIILSLFISPYLSFSRSLTARDTSCDAAGLTSRCPVSGSDPTWLSTVRVVAGGATEVGREGELKGIDGIRRGGLDWMIKHRRGWELLDRN